MTTIHGKIDSHYRNNKCPTRWSSLQKAWREVESNLDANGKWKWYLEGGISIKSV
jgi:hypothetical protein